jgi:hypothetical protein
MQGDNRKRSEKIRDVVKAPMKTGKPGHPDERRVIRDVGRARGHPIVKYPNTKNF